MDRDQLLTLLRRPVVVVPLALSTMVFLCCGGVLVVALAGDPPGTPESTPTPIAAAAQTSGPRTPAPSLAPPTTTAPSTSPKATAPPPVTATTRTTTTTTTQPAATCHPSYTGACVPIASDVDCAGGSGNGPAYVRGPVYVVGPDEYKLDSNGDGVGCESS